MREEIIELVEYTNNVYCLKDIYLQEKEIFKDIPLKLIEGKFKFLPKKTHKNFNDNIQFRLSFSIQNKDDDRIILGTLRVLSVLRQWDNTQLKEMPRIIKVSKSELLWILEIALNKIKDLKEIKDFATVLQILITVKTYKYYGGTEIKDYELKYIEELVDKYMRTVVILCK